MRGSVSPGGSSRPGAAAHSAAGRHSQGGVPDRRKATASASPAGTVRPAVGAPPAVAEEATDPTTPEGSRCSPSDGKPPLRTVPARPFQRQAQGRLRPLQRAGWVSASRRSFPAYRPLTAGRPVARRSLDDLHHLNRKREPTRGWWHRRSSCLPLGVLPRCRLALSGTVSGLRRVPRRHRFGARNGDGVSTRQSGGHPITAERRGQAGLPPSAKPAAARIRTSRRTRVTVFLATRAEPGRAVGDQLPGLLLLGLTESHLGSHESILHP